MSLRIFSAAFKRVFVTEKVVEDKLLDRIRDGKGGTRCAEKAFATCVGITTADMSVVSFMMYNVK